VGDIPYRQLVVWKEAHAFALQVYRSTEIFPKYELYGVTSQLRRAALSVPTNVVEGYARRSSKECRRFFDISVASLAEAGYLIEFARDLGYFRPETADHLFAQQGRVGYLLHRFLLSSASHR
jgi:four helix bundle protein